MNKDKLTVLLSLLDDPNPEIFQRIEEKLSEFPVSFIPQLEDKWLESKDPIFQERLEHVINKIQFKHVKRELVEWSKNENPNLIEGAILVNKSYNPNLLLEPIRKKIELIIHDVQLEINDQLTSLEKIKILNHFFYNIHNYHPLPPSQPTNWDGDIGTVLSQKHGNYIILAIIYAGIAQELGIPVYGINLNESFMLCYLDTTSFSQKNSKSVVFYINPIDRGSIFGHKDLEEIIFAKNLENLPRYYEATSNVNLIKRLVQHEISVYKKLNLESFLPNFKELYKAI